MKNKIVTWGDLVKPFQKYKAQRTGAVSEVARRMQERTGEKKMWRQLVDVWTTDSDRQAEPRYAIGLVLIEEINKLMAESPIMPKESRK